MSKMNAGERNEPNRAPIVKVSKKVENRNQKKLLSRLINLPPREYVRPKDELPFHIPHKKILLQAEASKKSLEDDYEPIPGLLAAQHMYGRRKPVRCADSCMKVVSPPRKEEDTSGIVISDKLVLPSGEYNLDKLFEVLRTDDKINFLYLDYALPKSSINYHPYCFKVVPYEETNKNNYRTVSKNGFMHIYGSEQYFISLDDWEIEYKTYYKLKNIRTFRQFCIYKYFRRWKSQTRRTKYEDARDDLQRILVLFRPELLNAVMSVRSICCSLSSLSFLDVTVIEKLSLEEFMIRQRQKTKELTSKLLETRKLCQEILDNACQSDLLELGFTLDDSNLKVDSSLVGTAAMIGVETTKDGRYRMTSFDQRLKLEECERISRAIGLTDYLIVEFLHLLVVNSLTNFDILLRKHLVYLPPDDKLKGTDLSETLELDRTTRPKFPLFLLELMPEKEYFVLKPQFNEWMDSVTAILLSWESAVMSIEPFMGDSFFDPFTEPVIAGDSMDRLCGYGPSLSFVLAGDVSLNKQKQVILDLVQHNLESVMLYSDRFHDVRQRYIANLVFEPALITNETVLEKLRNMLIYFTEEKVINESLVKEQPLGLFLLSMHFLQSHSIPETEHLLCLLFATIPKIGHDKVEELMNECAESQAYLEVEPITSLNYVEFVNFLEKCPDRGVEVDNWMEYLKELYDIAEEFGVPVSPDDENAFYLLGDKLTFLHNTVEALLNDREKIIDKFNNKIAKDIKELLDEIASIRKMSVEPWLIDINSNIDEVLLALGELSDQLDSCQKKAQTYKGYQRQLKVEVDRFEALDEVITEIKLRQMLWENLSQWDEIRDQWQWFPFSLLNPEDMQQIIAKFLKNIVQCEKGLPSNDIVPILKEKVETMRDKLPVITNLRNPNLKTRHWAQIEQILMYQFKPDEKITLRLLEEVGIYGRAREINEISGQASSEAGLETLIGH